MMCPCSFTPLTTISSNSGWVDFEVSDEESAAGLTNSAAGAAPKSVDAGGAGDAGVSVCAKPVASMSRELVIMADERLRTRRLIGFCHDGEWSDAKAIPCLQGLRGGSIPVSFSALDILLYPRASLRLFHLFEVRQHPSLVEKR